MICGFIHVYQVNNWEEILLGQLEKIRKSKLLDAVDRIFLGVNGGFGLPQGLDFYKVSLLYHIDKPNLYEALTFSCLRNISQVIDGEVFYIHTKGVSRNSPQGQSDWREMMEYFILTEWENCLLQLTKVDAAGCNWHLGEGYLGAHRRHSEGVWIHPHFSGTMWWANTDYVKKLPDIYPLKSRFECEFWIGSRTPIIAELWNSGVDHNSTPYPRSNYENKLNIRYFNGAVPVLMLNDKGGVNG